MNYVEFIKATEEIKMLSAMLDAAAQCGLGAPKTIVMARVEFLLFQVGQYYKENELVTAAPILRT